nr:MAG TPA: hypothetical protein [Caudoviricetes sp.]
MTILKYNNRTLKFIKRINNIYLFEDLKTKTKETFTLEQLAEFKPKAREIIVKNNNSNINYYEEKIKEYNKYREGKKSKGELIFEWLKQHPNKTAREIGDKSNICEYQEVSNIVRDFNKKYINKNKQICSYKVKQNIKGKSSVVNCYFAEDV